MSFAEIQKEFRQKIDEAIQNYLFEIKPTREVKGLIELHRAMGYSLTSGGSRYRPTLVLLTGQMLGLEISAVMPFGVALELVHTYSLIHDDLPAMDDDDFRRGQPTNHKVFGEPLAILAGDALCTDSARFIGEKYSGSPTLALELIQIISRASGPQGMVGGQAIDIFSKNENLKEQDMEFLHQCKTVALFRAATAGAGAVGSATAAERHALDEFAQALGLLFQITDDIQDRQGAGEPSFIRVVGLEKARKYCQNLKDKAYNSLSLFGPKADNLKSFVDVISERVSRVPGKNK